MSTLHLYSPRKNDMEDCGFSEENSNMQGNFEIRNSTPFLKSTRGDKSPRFDEILATLRGTREDIAGALVMIWHFLSP